MRSVIEVEWGDEADDEKAERLVEATLDSLMERLLGEGVVDPSVSATLHASPAS